MQAVMIFDTWGGTLAHAEYLEFSLAYMKRIIAGLTRERDGVRVPSIVFTKGCGNWLDEISRIGCDAMGVDWSVDIGAARTRVGQRVALQGNLDPMILFSDEKTIREKTKKILENFGNENGHVFNLGHGISQFTPPESITVLVDEVHKTSANLRKTL